MNRKEVNYIINNYKPIKGFYDLSKKPNSLTKMEYAKVLKIQEFLALQEKVKKYVMKMLPVQWMEDKELSANYQQTVREHWGKVLYKNYKPTIKVL